MPRRRLQAAKSHPAKPTPLPPAPSPRRRVGLIVAAIAAALGLAASAAWLLAGRQAPPPAPIVASAPAAFVGAATCAGCHAVETTSWRGSQHARAMQEATPATVLGDFADASFVKDGVTTRFARRGDRFLVTTDGPDGAPAEFEIAYTFGVEPLQQYLIAFPDGRMQALSVAWDSRPAAAGGQRWFHLYPDERIGHRDALHWTRLNQNWNWMCAECHSTELRRNYDAATDRYATTWKDINVACEACHGPASNHLAWAATDARARARDPGKGLAIPLDARRGASWAIDPATGNAVRSPPLATSTESETCAVCHARRSTIGVAPGPTGRLADTHDLALLREGLYFADGQQRDEVYVHGSFLQSRMHARGVTCSDCHDPHSEKLRAPGDAVCAQCHLPAKYEATAHHLHPPASAGARCANCHMPQRSYMVVDPRRDHSFRVPRPDLTQRLGVPNACTACHADRDAAWAASAIEAAHGPQRKGFQNFADALAAGRAGAPGAAAQLAALAGDPAQPAIARATALAELARFPVPTTLATLERALADPDPLLRGAALDALLAFPPETRGPLAERLAADPLLAVRVRAGRALADAPEPAGMTPERRARRAEAVGAWMAAQRASAERPESHLNLGIVHAARGEALAAEGEYRAAIRLQTDFAPAYVNLADLFRRLAREADAAAVLEEGARAAPDDADLAHALGLQRVRQRRLPEALALFTKATAARPENPRYAYVHAVALHSAGRRDEAVAALEASLARAPNDLDLLYALAAFAREAGRTAVSQEYLRRLAALAPQDPRAAALLRQQAPRD